MKYIFKRKKVLGNKNSKSVMIEKQWRKHVSSGGVISNIFIV